MKMWMDVTKRWNIVNDDGEVIVNSAMLIYHTGDRSVYAVVPGVGGARSYNVNPLTLEVDFQPAPQPDDLRNQLEEIEIDMTTLDTRAIYPFCLHYDSLQELSKRLNNSIILVGNEPVYVSECWQTGKDYFLAVSDRKEKTRKINFEKHFDKMNVRSVPPGYINGEGRAEFLHRYPARIARQGMCSENARLHDVGPRKNARNIGEKFEALSEFLSELKDRKSVEYDQGIERSLHRRHAGSIRLSPNVAAYWDKKNDRPVIEYKSRYLGAVSDGVVTGTDTGMAWIVRDLQRVGLQYREGGRDDAE